MSDRRLQLVDRITDSAFGALRDFPEDPRVATILLAVAGAVAAGDPWLSRLDAFTAEQARAFIAFATHGESGEVPS